MRDAWLREQLAMCGKTPGLATVVTVDEAFMHCPKCMVRAKFWEKEHWPDLDGLPSLARVLIDHARLSESLEEVQASIDQSLRERLY